MRALRLVTRIVLAGNVPLSTSGALSGGRLPGSGRTAPAEREFSLRTMSMLMAISSTSCSRSVHASHHFRDPENRAVAIAPSSTRSDRAGAGFVSHAGFWSGVRTSNVPASFVLPGSYWPSLPSAA